MEDILKRRGSFEVTREMIEKCPDSLCKVFAIGMIVIAVDWDYARRVIKYTAFCKHFDVHECLEGQDGPEYEIKFEKNTSVKIKPIVKRR